MQTTILCAPSFALTHSRIGRFGQRCMRAAQWALALEPMLIFASVFIFWLLAWPFAASGQTTGGQIFGSDQQVGNAIREAIKWGRNLLFIMGIVFTGWAVLNYGTEKPSGKQIIAAIGCFAFGGIVALVYSISQGNAVNFDTGFGN